MEINSIYSTPECSAWSRDFDYDNYLMLHKACNSQSKPVDVSTYTLLCKAFHNQMSVDFQLEPRRDL